MTLRLTMSLLSAVLVAGLVFNCGGGGGGSGYKDALRKDYKRDRDAYKRKWGLPPQ